MTPSLTPATMRTKIQSCPSLFSSLSNLFLVVISSSIGRSEVPVPSCRCQISYLIFLFGFGGKHSFDGDIVFYSTWQGIYIAALNSHNTARP